MLSSLLSAKSFQDTVRRFPLSSLSAFLFFLLVVTENHSRNTIPDEERFYALFAGGFFIFGMFSLVSESLGTKGLKKYAPSFLSFIGFAAIIFLSDLYERQILFIFPALLLLIMSAPFVLRDSSDTAFWHFNAVLFVNVKIGIFASIVLGGGISAALAAIDFLFGVDINGNIYEDVWAFACILFGPFYVFSQLPKTFDATEAIPAYEGILKFIVTWLLSPLVIVYMLILYAYFAKILIQWELPQGHLATIITGFGGAGVVAYLVSWPFRETGNKMVRLVHRAFFPALILPTLMMCISIGVRLHEYGLTEERYMIILTAVWFTAVIGLFLLKMPGLKLIPLILGGTMIFASFGPWGATSLSGHSQMTRLDALLTKYNILQDGYLIPLKGNIYFEDEKSINSIFRYFQRRKQLDELKETFPLKEGTWTDNNYSREMIEQIGLDHISEYMTEKRQREQSVRINYRNNPVNRHIDITGYEYFYHITYLRNKARELSEENKPKLTARLEKGVVHINLDNGEPLTFDVAEYSKSVNQFAEEKGYNEKPLTHVMTSENEQLRGKLYLLIVRGEKRASSPKITEVSFIILLDKK